jgi:uncharacterized protein (DUF2384 family)
MKTNVALPEITARIMLILLDLYLTEEEADAWLDSKAPAFGGATPREMIATGRGKEVMRLLDATVSGAYL